MNLEGNITSKRIINVFSHMVADMKPWIMLLNNEPVPENIECMPSWSIQQCRDELNEVNTKINRIISTLDTVELKNTVNSQGKNGKVFTHTVSEILTQIASHNQYHRGQIEMLIKDETDIDMRTIYMSYLRDQQPSLK